MATAQMDTVIRHLRRAGLRDGMSWTDGQLLTSFIDQKDEAAFEALVRRHGQMVFGICRRVVGNYHDAEDAFQATFLVLARKASSVRPRESVVNWLHGVALRSAMKAKAITAKRRGREKQVTEMPEPEATRQEQWRDLQPLLDQELNGLPENYRLPILLCDLEGKTIKEATRQLGWPQGTVAGRLARGRKLLAKRLANRGVVLSAGSLTAVVSRNAASAAVPTSLMGSTLKAATMAAGQATVAGVVPAKVAILMEGVLKAMLPSKLKTVTVGLLLVTLLCGAAGTIYSTQAAEKQKGEQRSKTMTDGATSPEVASPPKAAPQREYVIRSRLLEDNADEPMEVLRLPKVTVDEGQLAPLQMTDGPRNLLDKVVDDEKIKIGTFFDVRVKRLGGNKVRLFCSFQRNELKKASVSEIRVLGNSVQAIQDVELHKAVQIVLRKEAKGSAQQWVEITVDEITVDEQPLPAPAVGEPPQKRDKE